MRKTMKRCLTATLGALAFVAAGFGVSGLKTANVAKAENTNLKIAGKTLNVSDNVNVVFYVPKLAGEKSAITVHVTEQEKTGAKEVTLSAASTNYTHEGTEYYRFVYSGVMAYQMSNELYAYAQLGDEKSDEVKYSVLEYAYKKLGKANKAKDETAGLEDLLTSMLGYGSAAARFTDNTLPADFSYEDDYTYVSVTNATFEDGFNYGIFKKGAELTITPDEGYKISDTPNAAFSVEGEAVKFTVPDEKLIDATSFVEDTSVDAATKVEYELSQISMSATSAYVGDTLTLKTTPASYNDVTITWSATGATMNGNVVTFDTVGNVTLTATVACGGVSDSKTFENIVTVTENPYPVEGKAYALKTTDNYYVTSIGSGYLVPTENAVDAALSFYFEKVGEGKYNIRCGSTNKYVGGESGGTDLMFSADPTTGYTWTLDVDEKLMTSDNGRFLGRNGSSIKHYAMSNVNSYPHVWFEEIRELTADEKIAKDKDALTMQQEVTGETTIDLVTVGLKYGSTITWEITQDEHELITRVDDTITIAEYTGEEETSVTLTATFELEGMTEDQTKEFTITVNPVVEEEPGTGGAGEAEAFEITFTLGANGAAEHKDGSSAKTTYSETVDGYTLNITGGDKMYPTSYDAKGNSCIKFGTGSVVGKCSFTVPEEVTEVVIYVAKYKANASKINVNGTPYTLTKNSNDGAYDEIVVDTTTNKTVNFTTVSGGVRAMLNTIVFKGAK